MFDDPVSLSGALRHQTVAPGRALWIKQLKKFKHAVSRVSSRRLFLELTTARARAVDEVERNASLECCELLCGSC